MKLNKCFVFTDTFTSLAVVVCSVVLFALMLTALGGLSLTPQTTAMIYMDDANGLKRNAEVRYAGVKVGRVLFVGLLSSDARPADLGPDKKVLVRLEFDASLPVSKGVTASIGAPTLLGDNCVILHDRAGSAGSDASAFASGQVINLEAAQDNVVSSMTAQAAPALLEALGIGKEQRAMIDGMLRSLALQLTLPDTHPGNAPENRTLVAINEIANSINSQVSLDRGSPFTARDGNLAFNLNSVMAEVKQQMTLESSDQKPPPPTLLTSLGYGLANFSDASGKMQKLVASIEPEQTGARVQSAVGNVDRLSANLAVVSEELRKFSAERGQGGTTSAALSERLESIAKQLEGLSVDLRVTVQTFGHLAEAIRKDPNSLIFGGKPEPPSRQEIERTLREGKDAGGQGSRGRVRESSGSATQ